MNGPQQFVFPEWWRQLVDRWIAGRSMRVIGIELAELTERTDGPFDPSTVSRYRLGKIFSMELTEALVRAMGVPIPIVTTLSQEHADLCAIAGQLYAEHPKDFAKLLATARKMRIAHESS